MIFNTCFIIVLLGHSSCEDMEEALQFVEQKKTTDFIFSHKIKMSIY